MTYVIQVQGGEEFVRYLRTLPVNVQRVLKDKITLLSSKISSTIKNDRLSGQLLKVKTGRLRASIYARTYFSTNSATLSVGSRGDVPYAAIQDLGGDIRGHVIYPKAKRVLAFMLGGRKVFAQRVYIPPMTLKGRNYMEIQSLAPEIISVLTQGVNEAVVSRLGT